MSALEIDPDILTPLRRASRATSPQRGGWPTLPFALLITVLLTAWWAALAWRDLGALRLPEPDDVVRLAQIRDWLGGQAFADLSLARLGPLGGTAMPWSRLPDLAPALLIRLLSPLLGAARAEVAAVIFWPEILFLTHLLLVGAIARRLGPPATALTAIAIAALAFPAVALFAPGRIDHHGLQIVLVEAMLLALLGKRTLWAGAAAGASLLIAVESAPVIAAAMLVTAAMWARDRRPIAGVGAGLILAALVGFAFLRPQIWPADRCDGFTPPVFAMMLVAGGGWLILAGLGPRLPDRRWRVATAFVLGALLLAIAWVVAPVCFINPYGPADPLLSRIWPGQAGEMGGLLAQSLGTLIAWTGLPLVALATATWFAFRDSEHRDAWLLLVAVVAVSVLGAFVQTRSLWFAAALAAPILAQLIHAAAKRGLAWRVGAWLVSIGLIWQTIGTLAFPAPVEADCADRDTLAALDRLDTGAFAAPPELGAALIGATQHRSLGGPHRRNARGNRAWAELLLSSPEEARYQASLWAVDYIALCPSPTGGLPPALLRSSGLAAHLLGGAGPAWLDPVPLIGSNLLVWRVVPIAGPGLRP